MGSGGWLVSVALRHAWERRASAVVVAAGTNLDAVVGLAERLGITLLATDGDPADVALNLAGEIGAALSVVDAELARFARAVAKEASLADVLRVIARELDGIMVALDYEGVVLASAGALPKDTVSRISVDVRGTERTMRLQLAASVPRNGVQNLQLVRTILEVAAPSVQAAWLRGNALEAAASVPTAVAADLPRGAAADLRNFQEDHGNLLLRLGWRPQQRYTAVWIHAPAAPDRAGRTAVLRLLWRKVAVRSPLAEVTGGWLAIVPTEYPEAAAQLEARIESRLGAALAELGLTAGLSRWQPEDEALPALVQEARLAAESAYSSGAGTVLAFGSLGVEAASYFVDPACVALVAELAMPRLMAAPDRDCLVLAVATFLDHRGSVSAAAKALDLHRNTLQTRLNRARDLDIPLD